MSLFRKQSPSKGSQSFCKTKYLHQNSGNASWRILEAKCFREGWVWVGGAGVGATWSLDQSVIRKYLANMVTVMKDICELRQRAIQMSPQSVIQSIPKIPGHDSREEIRSAQAFFWVSGWVRPITISPLNSVLFFLGVKIALDFLFHSSQYFG